MLSNVIIRDETPGDVEAIGQITVAAFATLAVSQHTEHFIIAALRRAQALSVSLVAESAGAVIGHIAFSPVVMSDGCSDWYGMGPLSVAPGRQRAGVGTALVQAGLARLRRLSAAGCCLVGHPEYYTRFGFRPAPGLSVDGVPDEFFFVLSFGAACPQGHASFHPAFFADGSSAEEGASVP